MADKSVTWRRVDQPGHEAARLIPQPRGWHLTGTAVFATDGQPCCLHYLVVCDPDWRTLSGRVTGWIGEAGIDIDVTSDAGRWRFNGTEQPDVTDCVDLDLSFSPPRTCCDPSAGPGRRRRGYGTRSLAPVPKLRAAAVGPDLSPDR